MKPPMHVIHSLTDSLFQGKRDFARIIAVVLVFGFAVLFYALHVSKGSPALISHLIFAELDRGEDPSSRINSSFLQTAAHRRVDAVAHSYPQSPLSATDSIHDNETLESPHVTRVFKQSNHQGHPRDSDGDGILSNESSIDLQERPRAGFRDRCKAKYVYIYKLPPEFNEDLVDKCGRASGNWVPMCGNLDNNGYGPLVPDATLFVNESDAKTVFELKPAHAWYRTEQFSLEVIFHNRLRLGYPCLTENPELASAFYIPYYAAMDTAFTLFGTYLPARDRLTQRLVGWLSGSEVWQSYRERRRHFMVLGRTSWDFCRNESADGWGSALLSQAELSNVTTLLIERRTWASKEIAIPYPSSFHPSSAKDVQIWQETLREQIGKRTKLLASFVGSTTRGFEHSRALRAELAKQCHQAGANVCKQHRCGYGESAIDCAGNPERLNAVFLSSIFCLQPSGDSPTRKSIFDSLVAGCIPVLFSPASAYTQYVWHLPEDGNLYSVFIDEDEVIRGKIDVMATLSSIANDTVRLRSMQEQVISMVPSIVYALASNRSHSQSKSFHDAVDVVLDNVLADSPVPTA
ncbi:hypothetical protein KP509_34G038800 [Ceratopteris richardii]|uniref:Exostosin GT47 domain-containing protein n=1 Tax=Ceratopteris richardii TaxID=49495 RepID=A0A8T2QKE3_CERRI|nr:hypothetical protein KP509_34G038800 [Ceratopteris richardii]